MKDIEIMQDIEMIMKDTKMAMDDEMAMKDKQFGCHVGFRAYGGSHEIIQLEMKNKKVEIEVAKTFKKLLKKRIIS